MPKTYYDGKPSDSGKNFFKVEEQPRSKSRKNGEWQEWQKKIAKTVKERLGEEKLGKGKLERVPKGSQIHLYVTFLLNKELYKENKMLPDVDNLLKVFLDPLGKKYSQGKDGANFFNDDRQVRAVRAERVLVPKGKERVECGYLVTKTFKIVKVEEIAKEEVQENYRKCWQHPIRRIKAQEVKKNGGVSEPYAFIDNLPDSVFWLEQAGKKHPDPIPGYDWKEGEEVEGCMVFEPKPKTEAKEGQDEIFWRMKQWGRVVF